MEHPDNNSEVVKVIWEATTCEWAGPEDGGYGLQRQCAGLKAWKSTKLVAGSKNDATLLNVLADDDPKARFLAAEALERPGEKWVTDKAVAVRVVGYAKQEKHDQAGVALGRLVGRINLEKTGLSDPVLEMLSASYPTALRQGIVSAISSWNYQDEVYSALRNVAEKDKDTELRGAAIRIMWNSPDKQHDANCKMFLQLASDADDSVSGEAAHMCAKWKSLDGCTAEWDALLDVIDKRNKADKIQHTGMVVAMQMLFKQPKVTAAQKKRMIAIATAIFDNTANDGIARSLAGEVKVLK